MKRELNKDIIDGTIAFIESRLTENLKINELAEQAYFSKTHYQRLFHSIVGETVMDYIKKRRLQIALSELCDTKIPILEISMKLGYESHEGFTRAFKSYYGITPSRYRSLNGGQKKLYHGEVTKMREVSNEVATGIKMNMSVIYEMLGQSALYTANLSESMRKVGEDYGAFGAAMTICSAEAYSLSKRMEALKESACKFAENEQKTLEVYSEANSFVKNLDDINFQANLLAFLSGIEIARMGLSKDTLASVEKQLSELIGNITINKNNMIDLIKGMVSLIRADIKNEAAAMIKEIISLIKNVADEGKIIIANGKNTLNASTGFLCITRVVSNRVKAITPIIRLFEDYKHALETGDLDENKPGLPETPKTPLPSPGRIAEIKSALYSLEEFAFSMNIAAFNATVETARNGNQNSYRECAERIRKYAGTIQQSCNPCTELFNESVRLSNMLQTGTGASIIAITHKLIDDIMFQGKIMVTQLGLEAERANIDAFKNLAQNADKELHVIYAVKREEDISKCKSALTEYYENIRKHTKACHDEAKTLGKNGIPFKFIASEYDLFVNRLKSSIDCL